MLIIAAHHQDIDDIDTRIIARTNMAFVSSHGSELDRSASF